MAWADIFAGLAFYLIIEGILPFISPRAWRRGLSLLGQFSDRQLQRTGFVAIAAGLVLLFVVRA